MRQRHSADFFFIFVIIGACHSDELLYLFHPHGLSNLGFESPEPGSTERTHIERMTQMWTDFAKTG